MGYQMRRKERQLSTEGAAALLERGSVCHLAMVDEGEPYLVTMNYGYREGTLYFHCAHQGRKMDILAREERVCFSVITRHDLAAGEEPCEYTMKYESVVGKGRVRLVPGPDEKRAALGLIMAQYAPGEYRFPEKVLDATAVFAVDIEEMTGKSNC